MSEGNGSSSRRFVPSGVDAQSWIGFEHRIQERRFNALIETIKKSIAERDGVTSRVALEEARELRPAAPELEALAARVALLPTGAPLSAASAYPWYRGASAVAMFAVGVGLVIGIESLRPTLDAPSPGPDTVTKSVALAPADTTPTPSESVVRPVSAAPTEADTARTPVPQLVRPVTELVRIEPTGEEPVGAAGVSRAQRAAATAAVPNRQTFRPAEIEPEPVLPASREIPDDYVATGTRGESRSGHPEVAPAGPAIAANVMPQPVSIMAPPPPVASVATVAPAATAAPAVRPRADDTRVAQVLNQYARAYGRLDPDAARAVWPTVDERALSRAFASLESQAVSFDKCDIDVKGNLASASCSGTASYVGKIGSRQSRTEARQWNFELKLHGDDWKIEKAEARQLAYAR